MELSMLIKNVCWEIQTKTEDPSIRFLLMFIGVVPGSLILFATGVRDFSVLQQPSLAWAFLAIATLVSVSTALGYWMFGQKTRPLSISAALPFISRRKK